MHAGYVYIKSVGYKILQLTVITFTPNSSQTDSQWHTKPISYNIKSKHRLSAKSTKVQKPCRKGQQNTLVHSCVDAMERIERTMYKVMVQWLRYYRTCFRKHTRESRLTNEIDIGIITGTWANNSFVRHDFSLLLLCIVNCSITLSISTDYVRAVLLKLAVFKRRNLNCSNGLNNYNCTKKICKLRLFWGWLDGDTLIPW